MKIESNDKACSIHFESIIDLLEYAYEGHSAADFNMYLSSSVRQKTSWLGMENGSYRNVIDHVLLGHKKMHEELKYRAKWLSQQTSDDYEQLIVKRKRKRFRGDWGDDLDIHAMNQGNFDKCYTMRKHIETSKETNLVTLLIDVGGLASDEVDNSLWRGAVAIKLTDQLIQAGKSVRVVVGSSCGGLYRRDSRIHTTTITVKEYNEPLSMERLSAMCHLGFHRTFNFGARCAFDKPGLNDSMGWSTDWLKDNYPITMQEEVKNGHTKYIYLARANDRYEGIHSLERAYKQMKEFATVAS